MCNNLTKEQALATAARYGLQREVADRMKKKQIIRLTESDLHRIVKDVANKILNENMKFVHVHSCKCPNCGANLYNYIWNPQNIIHTSDRYEHFDVDGFQFCRNAYYKCPNCGQDFYVRMGSNNEIFKNLQVQP